MKKDQSPVVPQRDKIKERLTVRDLNWTEKQKVIIDASLDKHNKIIVLNGPAGSSKTLLAVYSALKLLNEKKVSDIIYIRSAVESSDAKLGYLPGDVGEKLHFYNLPFYDKLEELLSRNQIDLLRKEERISAFPVGFTRGASWNAKCIIVDESQNLTLREIVTILTRIGNFTKLFLLADPTQSDLTNGKSGGFERVQKLFDDEESRNMGIIQFEFDEEDIMRSLLVRFLVKKFKNLHVNPV